MKPYGEDKQITPEMMTDFHSVFYKTDQGLRVLQTLGEHMGFFNDDLTPEDLPLRNMFCKILVMCGVWVQPNGNHIIGTLDEPDGWIKLIGKKILSIQKKEVPKGKLNQLMEQKYAR